MPEIIETESDDNKEFSELLEEYQDQEKMHHFEGDRGVEQLNKLANAIGYSGHQFKYGSSLEEFLSDNPGACGAIVDWLAENGEPFRDELISSLKEPEIESEEESDDN